MSEWTEVPLGELVDIHDSRRIPLSSRERSTRKGPFPYYGAQGVIDHIDDYIFDGRYILVPEDGENLRSRKLPIAYFADGRFWVNNHAHIIKAKPDRAVDRFVQSALEATHIGRWVTGAAQPKLSQANLKQIPILVPGRDTQQLIAAVLDAFDELIENNRRRVEVLEEMARAIYREWFVKFRYPRHEDVPLVDSALGPIPAGWACVRSGELVERGVLEIGDGYRAKNSEMTKGSGLPFVRVGNVRDGYLDLSQVDRLPASYRESLKSKVSRPGDTVLCMKGTVGRMARITRGAEPMAYSPQVSFWRSLCEALVPASFLHEWLRGESFERQCAAAKGSTAMADYVNLRDQRNMSFLLPTEEVVRGFADTIGPIHSLSDGLRASATRLSDIRDLLLPNLVTGQIDVLTLDLDALVSISSTAGAGVA